MRGDIWCWRAASLTSLGRKAMGVVPCKKLPSWMVCSSHPRPGNDILGVHQLILYHHFKLEQNRKGVLQLAKVTIMCTHYRSKPISERFLEKPTVMTSSADQRRPATLSRDSIVLYGISFQSLSISIIPYDHFTPCYLSDLAITCVAGFSYIAASLMASDGYQMSTFSRLCHEATRDLLICTKFSSLSNLFKPQSRRLLWRSSCRLFGFRSFNLAALFTAYALFTSLLQRETHKSLWETLFPLLQVIPPPKNRSLLFKQSFPRLQTG